MHGLTDIVQLPFHNHLKRNYHTQTKTFILFHFHLFSIVKQQSEIFRRLREYRTHYFTKEDADRIVDSETYLDRKTAFQIAYDTGARAGEMIVISAEHFDFEKGQMLLWDSKKKSWKMVPLSQKSIVTVQTYLNVTKIKSRLFKVTTKTLNNWIKDRCESLGIKPDVGLLLRWHSWRGTFIRTHRELGDKWLMQVTGDSYTTLLKYYEELTDEDLRKAKRGME